jgi:hypothetical protein
LSHLALPKTPLFRPKEFFPPSTWLLQPRLTHSKVKEGKQDIYIDKLFNFDMILPRTQKQSIFQKGVVDGERTFTLGKTLMECAELPTRFGCLFST